MTAQSCIAPAALGREQPAVWPPLPSLSALWGKADRDARWPSGHPADASMHCKQRNKRAATHLLSPKNEVELLQTARTKKVPGTSVNVSPLLCRGGHVWCHVMFACQAAGNYHAACCYRSMLQLQQADVTGRKKCKGPTALSETGARSCMRAAQQCKGQVLLHFVSQVIRLSLHALHFRITHSSSSGVCV